MRLDREGVKNMRWFLRPRTSGFARSYTSYHPDEGAIRANNEINVSYLSAYQ